MPRARAARPEAIFQRKSPRRGRARPLCGLCVTQPLGLGGHHYPVALGPLRAGPETGLGLLQIAGERYGVVPPDSLKSLFGSGALPPKSQTASGLFADMSKRTAASASGWTSNLHRDGVFCFWFFCPELFYVRHTRKRTHLGNSRSVKLPQPQTLR
jgi:hypothetical protein